MATTIPLSKLKARDLFNGPAFYVETARGTKFLVQRALRVDQRLGRFSAVNYEIFPMGWVVYKTIGELRSDLALR